jgi:hypothetical protein
MTDLPEYPTPQGASAVLRWIYGCCNGAVLIPVPLGQKGPTFAGWQNLTHEQTQRAEFQHILLETVQRGGNLGILQGPPSGLVGADIELESD